MRKMLLTDYFGDMINQFECVILKGSRNREELVDFWSDTDLLIVVKDDYTISEEYVNEMIQGLGEIQAKEMLISKDCITYRIVTLNEGIIKAWDIQVVTKEFSMNNLLSNGLWKLLYGHSEFLLTNEDVPSKYSFDYTEQSINSVWFRYYEAVKKVCRKDKLIGLHLVLDLVREYLVLLMIQRDVMKKTHIHRYGDNEVLPDDISLENLKNQSVEDILEYIKDVAKEYDEFLGNVLDNYDSRYSIFEAYVNKSESEVKQIQR